MKIHLDQELLSMEDELQQDEPPAAPPPHPDPLPPERRRRLLLGGGFAVAALLALALGGEEAPVDPPEDLSAAWSHLAPFTELHAFEGGWVGVLPGRWSGDAQAACEALHAEAELDADVTVTLLSAEGLGLAECGASGQ